ncbi:MAG: ribonuclease E/G, partial [Acidobacteria bacterium]|nr:ribonuclease E/G [Acidobacteriota bacterium]
MRLPHPNLAGAGSFERVDDSDEETQSPTAPAQETVAAHIDAFIDDVVSEEATQTQFERVSDDEKVSEAGAVEAEQASSTKRRRGGTRAASKRSSKKSAAKESEAQPLPAATGAEEAPAKSRRKAGSKATTKTAAKKSSKASKATASKKGRTPRAASSAGEGETDIDVLESEAARAVKADAVASRAADGGHFEADTSDETFEDAEASLTSSRSRAEFATRRGGRRRRRGGSVSGKHGETNHEDRSNGRDDAPVAPVEVDEPPAAAAAAAPPAPPPPQGNGRREREQRGGRVTRRERERSQPTITDLLREGQEILVQIAKEPIAKKGARITSHIALPGRFLVYMPTVEHVGVSRKIESDSERVRLRRLIQAIRAEEDVPSGG